MVDAGILGSAYRRGCLLELVGSFFPEIGDQKDAMGAFECSFEGLWPVQICFDDFVGEFTVLAWIAAQSAHSESAVGLEGAYHPHRPAGRLRRLRQSVSYSWMT